MINAIRSAAAAKWWLAAATLALLGAYIGSPRRTQRIGGRVSLGAAILLTIGIISLSLHKSP
jgi:hypothetical protein